MSGDSLLYWNQCTLDDCDKGCGLGRVRITFEEDSHIDVWLGPDALRTLSAAAIKEEAHRIVTSLLEEAEGDDATAAIAVVTGAGAATDSTSVDSTSVDSTSVDNTSVDTRSVDNTSVDSSSVENTSVDGTSVDSTATSNRATDSTSVDNTPGDNTSVDNTPTDSMSVENTSTNSPSVENTLINNTLIDNTPVDNKSIDSSSVENTSVDNTSFENGSSDNTPHDNTSSDNTSSDNTSAESTSTDVTPTDNTIVAPTVHATLTPVENATADVVENATATHDKNATAPALAENATAATAAAADSRIFRENSSSVAYQARLRLCSIVLHFRSKGLRPGAFLFLAFPGGEGVPKTLSPSNFDGMAGDRFAGEGTGVAGGAGVEVEARAGVGVGLWVTDEAAPLLPSLRSQWAASAVGAPQNMGSGGGGGGPGGGAGGGLKMSGKGEDSTEKEEGVGHHHQQQQQQQQQKQQHQQQHQQHECSSATNPKRQPRRQRCPRHHHHHHQQRQHRQHHCSCPPVLTLVAVPSARAPLPPLCCGVCGSSWETDAFGKGFRVYHIAVATNASLVWYLKKRFSEFLELHAALFNGCGGRGEGGRGGFGGGWGRGGGGRGGGASISKDRLPKPPRRTFGLMRIFPEKAERFRRGELEAYLQNLLLIPEAATNPAVLSFLGLVSTTGGKKHAGEGGREGQEGERGGVGGGGGGGDSGGQQREERDATVTSAASAATTTTTAISEIDGDDGAAGIGAVVRRPEGNTNGGSGSGAPREDALAGSQTCHLRDDRDNAVWETAERGSVRAGENDNQEGGGGGREEGMQKVERVSDLDQVVRGGDVVLFRCRGLLSRLQRWVSWSEWDHVGVVVMIGSSRPLELLESTPAGVRLYPLVERVRGYHEQGFASRVAFRRLSCPRPAEALSRLEAFARQAEGKAYGIALPFTPGWPRESTPAQRKPPSRCHPSPTPTPPRSPTATTAVGVDQGGGCAVDIPGPTSPSMNRKFRPLPPPPPPPPLPPPPPSYLCSRLVGAALSEMGVVREGGKRGGGGGWLWMFPGAFGQGGAVERGLGPGVTLGEEILVDAHEPEVASAVLFGYS